MALQFLQLLGFIFEGIGLIAGITIATVVMKKDSKYIGNRLMAAAMILLGVYMGSILTYDIYISDISLPRLDYSGLISNMRDCIVFWYDVSVLHY